MQVVYLRAFYKDLEKLQNKQVARQLLEIISIIENAPSLKEISGLKKLKGHSKAFSMRIGNYRAGLFIEGKTVEFARFLPRKDIYRYFPF